MNAAVGPGDRPAAVTGTMVGRYMLGRIVGKGLSSEVRGRERERDAAATTDYLLLGASGSDDVFHLIFEAKQGGGGVEEPERCLFVVLFRCRFMYVHTGSLLVRVYFCFLDAS